MKTLTVTLVLLLAACNPQPVELTEYQKCEQAAERLSRNEAEKQDVIRNLCNKAEFVSADVK